MINEIMEYNKKFVQEKMYEQYIADKYPNKKLAILSCMDTRLVEFAVDDLCFTWLNETVCLFADRIDYCLRVPPDSIETGSGRKSEEISSGGFACKNDTDRFEIISHKFAYNGNCDNFSVTHFEFVNVFSPFNTCWSYLGINLADYYKDAGNKIFKTFDICAIL